MILLVKEDGAALNIAAAKGLEPFTNPKTDEPGLLFIFAGGSHFFAPGLTIEQILHETRRSGTYSAMITIDTDWHSIML